MKPFTERRQLGGGYDFPRISTIFRKNRALLRVLDGFFFSQKF